jgi:hypothetical protein
MLQQRFDILFGLANMRTREHSTQPIASRASRQMHDSGCLPLYDVDLPALPQPHQDPGIEFDVLGVIDVV